MSYPCKICIVNAMCLNPCNKFIDYYDKNGKEERKKFEDARIKSRFFGAWKITTERDFENVITLFEGRLNYELQKKDLKNYSEELT